MPEITIPLDSRPTMAGLYARIEDLPLGLAGLIRGALRQGGTTADHLLHLADACDQARKELALVFPTGCADADTWVACAAILRDAAPLYPVPPREPAPVGGVPAMDLRRWQLRNGRWVIA